MHYQVVLSRRCRVNLSFVGGRLAVSVASAQTASTGTTQGRVYIPTAKEYVGNVKDRWYESPPGVPEGQQRYLRGMQQYGAAWVLGVKGSF
jgi:hypothetical protein